MRVLASTGLKGGVGKTSTAVNLAALAAAAGHRTLVWDLDPQGAATHCLHRKARVRGGAEKLLRAGSDLMKVARSTEVDGLDVVPADLSMRAADQLITASSKPIKAVRRLLGNVNGTYDLVVLDCPPGLGALVEAVAANADLLLVPVVPAPLALRAFQRYADFLVEARAGATEALAPFLSMIDRRKPLHRRMEEEVRADRRFLGAAIPESASIERMGHARHPSVITSPRSLATTAYRRLWAEAAERADVE
jgi:chromosome partitioning protein